MPQQAINTTLTEFVTLEATSCAACGVAFAVPKVMLAALRESHERFYCPSGHHLVFDGPTKAERLEGQLADKERQLQAERELTNNARMEAERIGRSNVALRGVVKRSKNRAVAAMCPVGSCRRHFIALARHMKSKHPGYAGQEIG